MIATTDVRVAAKRAMRSAKAAWKSVPNVPRMNSAPVAASYARIAGKPSAIGVTPVKWVTAVSPSVKVAVPPARIAPIFARIAACASTTAAVSATIDAAAAVKNPTTSVRAAAICAASALPQRSVRIAAICAAIVWTLSVPTAVWAAAASSSARAVRGAVKTAK